MTERHRPTLPLLAVVVTWAGLAGDAVAQGSVATDRAALEALYDATSGANWTESTFWKSSAPLGDWYGVTTDGSGRVTELELPENGLSGSIPPELGGLANLRRLTLRSNDLTGAIPSTLGRLGARGCR